MAAFDLVFPRPPAKAPGTHLLTTLLGGMADLEEFPLHPTLPSGLLRAVLIEVGGWEGVPSLPSPWSTVVKFLNESRGLGRTRRLLF